MTPSIHQRLSAPSLSPTHVETDHRPTLRVVPPGERVISISGVPDVCLIVSDSDSDEAALERAREVLAKFWLC
ncbi:MAG TPA: hypothetical protein VNQ76_01890 [Planctomicrobium sp.]|nr:hypothetical protein [Planctomicrobium sp.]